MSAAPGAPRSSTPTPRSSSCRARSTGSPRCAGPANSLMGVVVAALAPVFLLIVVGVGLRHSLIRLDTQWHGLERLTYYVLFPALLLAALAMSLLCLALRPFLTRQGIDGPAFTSIFQGATRWQTYVGLSVSG